MEASAEGGRVNQKRRTREAIVTACAALIETGAAITMPDVAQAAQVSEATAYRYFPDLLSLLQAAYRDTWPDPSVVLEPVQDSDDPTVRIACATEVLMRGVLAREGATRAVIAASITRPNPASSRPGYRFALIDHALAPLNDANRPILDDAALTQLKLSLAVIVSAEALFTLIDLCGLSREQAITSAVQTARSITSAAITPSPPHGQRDAAPAQP
ncbi:MAG: TetR/AcrR family transcriptional regulator [Solirubrobacteraceae bacterium]